LLLTVVVPSLNTKNHLGHMLSSLLSVETPSPLEVIVVDMGSTDGTVEMLETNFPQVTVLGDMPNKGYGAAANAGISAATGSHILVCNSDLVFPEGSVKCIVEMLVDSDQKSILGFRLEGLDGLPQRSTHRLPGPFALIWMFAAPLRYCRRLNSRLLGYLDDSAMVSMTQVGWVTGAALAAHRSLFEQLGGFDEAFFMGSEEVDLCRRVWNLGGTVLYVPQVRLLHVGGGGSPDADRALLWLAQGVARYTRKHFGRGVLAAARVGALAAYASSFPVWLARWILRRTSLREAVAETKRYGRTLWGAWRA
jgi:GT2 family glycosyltransferase